MNSLRSVQDEYAKAKAIREMVNEQPHTTKYLLIYLKGANYALNDLLREINKHAEKCKLSTSRSRGSQVIRQVDVAPP